MCENHRNYTTADVCENHGNHTTVGMCEDHGNYTTAGVCEDHGSCTTTGGYVSHQLLLCKCKPPQQLIRESVWYLMQLFGIILQWFFALITALIKAPASFSQPQTQWLGSWPSGTVIQAEASFTLSISWFQWIVSTIKTVELINSGKKFVKRVYKLVCLQNESVH